MLYHTRNGGVAWSPVPLAVPLALAGPEAEPLPFSPRPGLVPC